MNTECCGACKFFLPDVATDTGTCRRFPPQVYVAQQVSQMQAPPAPAVMDPKAPPPIPVMVITGSQLGASFPTMSAETGYCGEFAPRSVQ